MAASLGFDQFNVDTNVLARPSNAAVEEVACIEQAADLARRDIPAFELEAGRFGCDKQIREAAERRYDVLGDPVAKEILSGIARQVLERQHRYRGTPGEASRGGEARNFDRLRRGAEPK